MTSVVCECGARVRQPRHPLHVVGERHRLYRESLEQEGAMGTATMVARGAGAAVAFTAVGPADLFCPHGQAEWDSVEPALKVLAAAHWYGLTKVARDAMLDVEPGRAILALARTHGMVGVR